MILLPWIFSLTNLVSKPSHVCAEGTNLKNTTHSGIYSKVLPTPRTTISNLSIQSFTKMTSHVLEPSSKEHTSAKRITTQISLHAEETYNKFIHATNTPVGDIFSQENTAVTISSLGSTSDDSNIEENIPNTISTQKTATIHNGTHIPTNQNSMEGTSVLDTLTRTISNQQTIKLISPVCKTIEKIHTIVNTSSEMNNTTLSTRCPNVNATESKKKKKQKSSRSTNKPTSPKPKTKYIRPSTSEFEYRTTVTEKTPIIREIDYNESNELGEDNFKKFMTKTRVFVDKSLLVKEFLEHNSQVILITRPIHWGKSLNLNMLRKFFEIEVNPQGTMVPAENQLNRKIFCGGQIHINESFVKTLQPLKICQVPEAMIHQGKHPVVQFNYHLIRNGSYDEIKAGMKMQAIRSFNRHFYLENYFKANPNFLDESEICQLERYCDGKLTEKDIIRSIRFLSKLLYIYFNQRAIVLIDEYDTPLIEPYRNSNNQSEELNKVLQFYRSFYSESFKENPFLKKGLITGLLRIANSKLFVNLDNVVEYTLLDPEFNQFYGFTEQEFHELLKNLSKIESYSMKLVHQAYNYGGQLMYNPWSIKHYIENNIPDPHQLKNKHDFLFPGKWKTYSLEGIQQDVKSLLGGGCVQIPVQNEVTFHGLEDRRNFFNFILFTGLLSPVAKHSNGTYQLNKPDMDASLFFGYVLGEWMWTRNKSQSHW